MSSNTTIDPAGNVNSTNIKQGLVSSSGQHSLNSQPQAANRRGGHERAKDWAIQDQRSRSTGSGESASLLINDKASSDRRRLPPSQARQCPDTKHNQAQFLRHILRDTWFYELIAISISVSCLIAIGAVLKVYDGRVSPQLQYGLTLNAIISILATSTKAGLIYSVASSISQLKWRWVQQEARPLEDLQAYDDASRGFSGAFIMLFHRSGRSFVSVGAVITILAVALDPFIQQLLAYPIKDTAKPTSTAYTKRAEIFEILPLSQELLYAVEAGVWSTKVEQFARSPTCPSSNCTWPPFRSVGWCTKCADVTTSASVSGCSFDIQTNFGPNRSKPTNGDSYYRTAPCGISLDQGAPVDLPIHGDARAFRNKSVSYLQAFPPIDLVWLAGGQSAAVSLADSSYYNQTFLGIDNPHMVLAHASLGFREAARPDKGLDISHVEQCVLSMCERTYEVSVVRGEASSIVQSTNWGVFEPLDRTLAGPNLPVVPGSFQPQEYFWLPDPKDASEASLIMKKGFNTDANTSASLVNVVWGRTIASQIISNATERWDWSSGFIGWNHVMPDGTSPNNFSSDVMLSIASIGLGGVVDNVAASLTQLGLAHSNLTVFGTVGLSEIHVSVRWLWFILPCILELAAVGFLMTTIIVSRLDKVRAWKSSLHALLYHGLEKDLLDKQPVANHVSEMEQMARSVRVKLEASDSQGRLALRSQ